MELTGKTVAVLAEDLYNDFELWYPYYRLKEAGAKVLLVGPRAGQTYRSKAGLPVVADTGMDQVTPDQLDGLVIPGGYAPDMMRRHQALVKLVADVFKQGKPVAAICHAGWMLCSADVLAGRTATSFFAIKDDMVHAGADWVDREVVVDQNLITSRAPDDLPAFMRAVIQALA